MKVFSFDNIMSFEKGFRTKFINSVTGFKSANLIGTQSKDEKTNLAIFSSVIHMGSHPPYLGFITRPTSVVRNTYENILETGMFTVNSITIDLSKRAHSTSARYPKGISEFDIANFQTEYLDDFDVPFVKESPVGLGCVIKENIHIKANDTRMIIGQIEKVILREGQLADDGYLDLSKLGIASISSLDGYHKVSEPIRYQYAKPYKEIAQIQTNIESD